MFPLYLFAGKYHRQGNWPDFSLPILYSATVNSKPLRCFELVIAEPLSPFFKVPRVQLHHLRDRSIHNSALAIPILLAFLHQGFTAPNGATSIIKNDRIEDSRAIFQVYQARKRVAVIAVPFTRQRLVLGLGS